MLALAGCEEVIATGAIGGVMYITKPSSPPPADTAHSIQPHESWCYETLGDVVCYAHAQDVDPDRLVNVDPPNRYPLTPRAYADEIHPPLPPPPPVPVIVADPSAIPAGIPAAVEPVTPAAMPAVDPPPVKKKKKHTVKASPTAQTQPSPAAQPQSDIPPLPETSPLPDMQPLPTTP